MRTALIAGEADAVVIGPETSLSPYLVLALTTLALAGIATALTRECGQPLRRILGWAFTVPLVCAVAALSLGALISSRNPDMVSIAAALMSLMAILASGMLCGACLLNSGPRLGAYAVALILLGLGTLQIGVGYPWHTVDSAPIDAVRVHVNSSALATTIARRDHIRHEGTLALMMGTVIHLLGTVVFVLTATRHRSTARRPEGTAMRDPDRR